ncbi:MAG TPA: HlyD family efflux transporter periplasmic adaptor subunit [Thermoanaerobaculia bacterium]
MSQLDELLDRRNFSETVDAILYTRPRAAGMFFPLFCVSFFAAIGWAALLPFDRKIVARGDVRVAGEAAPVMSEAEGRLAEVTVTEGQEVERGAVLFRFDAASTRLDRERLDTELARATEAVAVLEQQREPRRRRFASELARLERELQRNTTLFQNGLQSRQIVDNLDSDRRSLIESAKQEELELDAQLVSAKQAVERLQSEREQHDLHASQRTIRAPQPGVISRLHVRTTGRVVNRGALLAEITPRGRPMELEAMVAPHDIGHVRTGLPARIKLDAYPYREYGTVAGRVSFIAPERGERGYRVRLVMPQVKQELRAGMTATVEIISERRPLYRVIGERLFGARLNG